MTYEKETTLIGIGLLMLMIGGLVFVLYMSHMEDKEINQKINNHVTECMEKAYYDGQRDALEGDIRIKQHKGNYVWSKSPWDNNQKTIFDPK